MRRGGRRAATSIPAGEEWRLFADAAAPPPPPPPPLFGVHAADRAAPTASRATARRVVGAGRGEQRRRSALYVIYRERFGRLDRLGQADAARGQGSIGEVSAGGRQGAR